MDETKREAKIAKKAAKAAAKAQKKSSAQTESSPAGDLNKPLQPTTDTGGGPTAAERSAAAAERQVRLQTYRVWIAIAVALVGIATLIVSTRSLWYRPPADEPADNAAAVPPAAP